MTLQAFALVLAMSFCSVVPASTQDKDIYRVAVELHSDGALIGAPTLTLRNGEPATVQVPGVDGYELTATVTPVEAITTEAVRVSMTLRLGSSPEAEPHVMSVVVRLNEPAALVFETVEGEVDVDMVVSAP